MGHSLDRLKKIASCILTSTPEREKAIESYKKASSSSRPRAKKAKRRILPQIVVTSSEEESIPLEDNSDTPSDGSSSDGSEDQMTTQNIAEVGSYAIIKVFSNDDNYKMFAGLLVDGPDEDNDFEVKFLKRSEKITNGFVFPDVDDIASVHRQDIVCVLPAPTPVAATKRLSGVLKFDAHLSKFGI